MYKDNSSLGEAADQADSHDEALAKADRRGPVSFRRMLREALEPSREPEEPPAIGVQRGCWQPTLPLPGEGIQKISQKKKFKI